MRYVDRIGTSGVITGVNMFGEPTVAFDSDGIEISFSASKLKKEEQKMELKIGDRVTVLPTSSLDQYIGKSGVISEFDEEGDPWVTMDGNSWKSRFYAKNVKKEEQKMEFKVGQKVTVVGQQYLVILEKSRQFVEVIVRIKLIINGAITQMNLRRSKE